MSKIRWSCSYGGVMSRYSLPLRRLTHRLRDNILFLGVNAAATVCSYSDHLPALRMKCSVDRVAISILEILANHEKPRSNAFRPSACLNIRAAR